MNFIDSLDPFVMQLIIIPFTVIGSGVLLAAVTKRILIGPLITLILNLLYEICYSLYFYPDSELTFSSWNVIFPLLSLFFSAIFVWVRKANVEIEIED
ncbi:hypothetical protein GWK91_02195 [Virgibacillus sp. MSP4-1]|uniref:hypothetical protein n=1 Tax=Virgibacillus sp. MSP4-1 TaxID=2700081 RepID=UPI00039A8F84|nr:hypothetical protein [Virgibacillus sp. MSP4-1]QHS21827.1 hypothetical protein GWK91_02195 [Virgibacillus sp. MSP4-1]